MITSLNDVLTLFLYISQIHSKFSYLCFTVMSFAILTLTKRETDRMRSNRR